MIDHCLPGGTRVIPLRRGSKLPLRGGHGHLKSTPIEDFDFSLVPEFCNYGIVLDGMFAVVDIDNPDFFWKWCSFEVPDGWVQKSRRGTHHLFLWNRGGTNYKVPGADVKFKGYIVGPGSVVEGHEYRLL